MGRGQTGREERADDRPGISQQQQLLGGTGVRVGDGCGVVRDERVQFRDGGADSAYRRRERGADCGRTGDSAGGR